MLRLDGGCNAIWGNDDNLINGAGKTLGGGRSWTEAVDVEWECGCGWW